MLGFDLVVLGLFLYVLPGIVAYSRHKKNKGAILLLDLLLGWTLVGWVAAMVWSVTND